MEEISVEWLQANKADDELQRWYAHYFPDGPADMLCVLGELARDEKREWFWYVAEKALNHD